MSWSQTISLCPCNISPQVLPTNFCISPQCLIPLCLQCTPIHFRYHQEKRTEIKLESLLEVKKKCKEKLNKTYSLLSKEIEEFLLLKSNENGLEEGIEKIKEIKDELFEVFTVFFNDLEERFRGLFAKETESNNVFVKIQDFMNKLQYYQMNIDTKPAEKIIKRVCLLDVSGILHKCKDDLENLRQKWFKEKNSLFSNKTPEEFVHEIDPEYDISNLKFQQVDPVEQEFYD